MVYGCVVEISVGSGVDISVVGVTRYLWVVLPDVCGRFCQLSVDDFGRYLWLVCQICMAVLARRLYGWLLPGVYDWIWQIAVAGLTR